MNVRRFIAAGLTAAALTAGVTGLSAGKAEAALGFEDIVGNFTGDDRDEIFWYVEGSGVEPLFTVVYSGDPEAPIGVDNYAEYSVNGTYDPIVGNFDGDAYDEILWYAPGTGADSIWNFTSYTTVTSTPVSITGRYTPTSGDFNGDGVDDVLWYAPGTTPDSLWLFNSSGGHSVVAQTINGTYTPIAGSFGSDATDDIIWYRPGTGQDFRWDFLAGTTSYASSPLTIGGTFQPIVLDRYNEGAGSDDIFWYRPGTGQDFFWNFVAGSYTSQPESVNGSYFSVISGDFFGDGHDDIWWYGDTLESVWDHQAPSGARRITTINYGAAASATSATPGALPRR